MPSAGSRIRELLQFFPLPFEVLKSEPRGLMLNSCAWSAGFQTVPCSEPLSECQLELLLTCMGIMGSRPCVLCSTKQWKADAGIENINENGISPSVHT